MNLLENWPMMASTGEALIFIACAVVMVAGALGVLFFKKAAYAALSMVSVMLGLAVLYVTTGAPFLGTTQVIVYTGAIMMLFLFVIMMIGLNASDEYQRQGRGRIIAAVLGGLGVAVMLVATVGIAVYVLPAQQQVVDPYSNAPITDLAKELFARHWFSMELAGALLITAAIGAMLLTHTDKLGPKADQHTMAEAKMRAYKERSRHIGQLPAPGVFANSNAFDTPAISGETLGPVEESVPRVLRVRGLDRNVSSVDASVATELQRARLGEGRSAFGRAAAGTAQQSGAWGMPGQDAPRGMNQPQSYDPTAKSEPTSAALESGEAAAESEEKEA